MAPDTSTYIYTLPKSVIKIQLAIYMPSIYGQDSNPLTP